MAKITVKTTVYTDYYGDTKTVYTEKDIKAIIHDRVADILTDTDEAADYFSEYAEYMEYDCYDLLMMSEQKRAEIRTEFEEWVEASVKDGVHEDYIAHEIEVEVEVNG